MARFVRCVQFADAGVVAVRADAEKVIGAQRVPGQQRAKTCGFRRHDQPAGNSRGLPPNPYAGIECVGSPRSSVGRAWRQSRLYPCHAPLAPILADQCPSGGIRCAAKKVSDARIGYRVAIEVGYDHRTLTGVPASLVR